MLVVAVVRLPYGFYTVMRWVVMLAATTIAWNFYARTKRLDALPLVFGFVGILFNPLAPIRLSRGWWAPIDLMAAALFIAVGVLGARSVRHPPTS